MDNEIIENVQPVATEAQSAMPPVAVEVTANAEQAATPAPVVEYTDFKAPEGAVIDAELSAEYKSVAKELGLTQEHAQKIADFGHRIFAKQAEAVENVRMQWQEASKADKEYGGDAFEQNVGVANKALKQFGTPELITFLDDTGLSNHPELIRAFYRAGKAISDDTFVGGDKTAQQPQTLAQALYGKKTA